MCWLNTQASETVIRIFMFLRSHNSRGFGIIDFIPHPQPTYLHLQPSQCSTIFLFCDSNVVSELISNAHPASILISVRYLSDMPFISLWYRKRSHAAIVLPIGWWRSYIVLRIILARYLPDIGILHSYIGPISIWHAFYISLILGYYRFVHWIITVGCRFSICWSNISVKYW